VDDGVGPLVMRVYLVRHGEATDPMVDPERPLTAAGRTSVERLAIWCAANDVAPAAVRHSGILRARQTAEILAARLSPAAGARVARGLSPDDDPGPWLDELVHETGSPMLVTHMPFVGELAALLTGRRAPLGFATAEIAVLEREDGKFRLVETWRPGATVD
jgi:phosphohistidine phosphatase